MAMSPSPLDPFGTNTTPARPKKPVSVPGAPAPATSPVAAVTRPVTPLARLKEEVAANQASESRVAGIRAQQAKIPIVAPLIREGRSGWTSTRSPESEASVLANMTLGKRVAEEQAGQQARVPALRSLTEQVNQQAAQDRAKVAAASSNRLLAGVGAAPSPYIAPAPTPTPTAMPKPAVAAPNVRFAGIDAAPDGLYRNPAAPQVANPTPPSAPSTFRTGDGRTGTLPAGVSMKMGANGVPEFSATGQSVADAAAVLGNRTQPGVSTQSFGTLSGTPSIQTFGSVNTNVASIARLGAASTLGMSVLDPRANDQIARPQVQLGPNQTSGNGAVRGVDQMAEQYASREDREARKKLLSDQDSRRFALELIEQGGGRRGRVATEALANLAGAQTALVAGGEKLSADAIQGRAGRDNVLANTGLEQAGADRRADLGFQAAQMSDATERYKSDVAAIERPTLKQDAAGNYVNIGSNGIAAPIVDPLGKPVQGMVQGQEVQQLSPDAVLRSFDSQERTLHDLMYNATPDDKPEIQQRIDALSAQRAALLSGGATKVTTVAQVDALPKGARYLAPDGRVYTKE